MSLVDTGGVGGGASAGDESAGAGVTASPGPLYHTHWTLPEFQALAAALSYERPVNLLVYDTGIGKSHIAMVTAAMLLEDNLVDLAIFVAEKNKMDRSEWPQDLKTYTNFDWLKYHGIPPARRAKVRESLPQALLSTYEIIKADSVEVVGGSKKRKKFAPSALIETLSQCRGVLLVYDEITKLGNRGSDLYKGHEILLKELRKRGIPLRILGLTATPIERSPENLYNVGRLLIPDQMPTVEKFEERYVAAKDFFGNPFRFKNLTRDDMVDPDVTPFRELFAPIIHRKQKTDPDVIDQFPQVIEEPPLWVTLGERHQAFYDTVVETFEDAPEPTKRSLTSVLRQIAGHPMALTLSEGKVAKTIVDTVGEAGLEALGCAKVERLIERLTPIIKGQGAQVVLFSFFTSVIHFVQRDLEAAGFTVAPFHRAISDKQAADNKAAWKAGEFEILFSSDAGARGINLPEAQYAFEYEMAITRANQVQRLNRAHRIDSKHPSVTFQSLVVADTIEEGLAEVVLRRDEWAEQLLDPEDPGENAITHEMRKRLLRISRKRVA